MKEISLDDGSIVSTIPTTALWRIFAQGDVYLEGNGSTFSQNINDPVADLIKTGAGDLTITGSNASSGGTTIKDGDLIVNNSTGLGSGDITIEGSELTAGKDLTIASQISMTGSSTLEAQTGKIVAINGQINGSGSLIFTGQGTFNISGEIENIGSATIDGPTVAVNTTTSQYPTSTREF